MADALATILVLACTCFCLSFALLLVYKEKIDLSKKLEAVEKENKIFRNPQQHWEEYRRKVLNKELP